MKPHSMEEKISYRLFLMGFLGLLFTAALCIFVFHRAFTAQAWDDLEKESDLIRAGYDLTSEPQQLSFFVTGDLCQATIGTLFVSFVNSKLWNQYADQIKNMKKTGWTFTGEDG